MTLERIKKFYKNLIPFTDIEVIWQAAQAEQAGKLAELEKLVKVNYDRARKAEEKLCGIEQVNADWGNMKFSYAELEKKYQRAVNLLLSENIVNDIVCPGCIDSPDLKVVVTKEGCIACIDKTLSDNSLWNPDNTRRIT